MAGQNPNVSSHNTMYLVYGALFALIALAALVALVFITSRTDTDTTQQQAAVGNATPTVDAPTIAASYGGATVGSTLDLTAYATKTLSIHGAATDTNGCDEIDNVSSNSWKVAFYRTTVTNGSTCTADNSNCYQDTEEAAGLTNCTTGGSDTTIDYDFTTEVAYYADATDSGSFPDYSATNWTAYVSVADDIGASANNSTTVDINTLKGVSTTASLNYSTVALGATSSPLTITITNTGNDNDLDPQIHESTGWSCSAGGVGTIAVGQVHWSKTSGFSYASGIAMTASAVDLSNLSIAKSTGAASTADVYLLLQLPTTGVAGTGCTSTLTVTGA